MSEPSTAAPIVTAIPDFIVRCDAYCSAAGRSRSWLSKRLFAITDRVDKLAKGEADVGVKTLARALGTLEGLESELSARPDAAEDAAAGAGA